MKRTILLLLLPICLSAQVRKISDTEYSIQKTTLSKLDQAAKKYLQCEKMTFVAEKEFIDLNGNLKLQDSILVSQEIKINRLTNDAITELANRIKLNEEIVDLKLQLKKEKRKNLWWRVASYTAVAVGGILIFK